MTARPPAIGDRVRIVKAHTADGDDPGRIAIVVAVFPGSPYPLALDFGADGIGAYQEDEVELVEDADQ